MPNETPVRKGTPISVARTLESAQKLLAFRKSSFKNGIGLLELFASAPPRLTPEQLLTVVVTEALFREELLGDKADFSLTPQQVLLRVLRQEAPSVVEMIEKTPVAKTDKGELAELSDMLTALTPYPGNRNVGMIIYLVAREIKDSATPTAT